MNSAFNHLTSPTNDDCPSYHVSFGQGAHTFESCSWRHINATYDGACIEAYYTASLSVSNNFFSDINVLGANGHGGCIKYRSLSLFRLTSTNFSHCTTPSLSSCFGGAIFTLSGSLVADHVNFDWCSAGYGGALYIANPNTAISFSSSTIMRCEAQSAGSAAYAFESGGSLSFRDCQVGSSTDDTNNGSITLDLYHNGRYNVTFETTLFSYNMLAFHCLANDVLFGGYKDGTVQASWFVKTYSTSPKPHLYIENATPTSTPDWIPSPPSEGKERKERGEEMEGEE
jgi:hypothetical protein